MQMCMEFQCISEFNSLANVGKQFMNTDDTICIYNDLIVLAFSAYFKVMEFKIKIIKRKLCDNN